VRGIEIVPIALDILAQHLNKNYHMLNTHINMNGGALDYHGNEPNLTFRNKSNEIYYLKNQN